MKPMRVIAKLLDGRVNSSDGLFNLDSILAYAWMLENHPDAVFNSEIARDGFIEPILPLAKGKDGRWKSSSGFYTQYQEITEYWHKKINDFDAAFYLDFRGRRGKIDAQKGETKAYRMPQVIRIISDIEFFAVGDIEEVQRLLNTYITNIGKKGAQGYGYVKKWIVEEWHEDWTERGPYGIMRPTPFTGELPDGQTYQIRMYATKPPYWLKENQTICIIPNVRKKVAMVANE